VLNTPSAKKFKPAPPPTLCGRLLVSLTEGYRCAECGVTLRACDAEPLYPGFRIICRNGHQFLRCEPA
jgi:hypothetical protein